MAKRAFITGATGFLGANLLELLLQENWELYALTRKNSKRDFINTSKVNWVEGSLGDYNSLLAAIPDNCDAIFHVAGNTAMWSKLNEQQYQDNVIGTRNMVRAALERKAGRFICTSSVAAFGFQDKMIDENTPSIAANDSVNYNKTKYLAELEVLEGIKMGLDAVILNPCHIVGAYDRSSWAQFIKLAYKEQLPGIPPGIGMFCFAQDVAWAHLKAYEKGRCGERYLLGGVEASFLDFINTLQKIWNRKPYKKDTPMFLMRIALALNQIAGLFSKKEPDVTPEKFQIVTKKVICNYDKAIRELDYQTTSLEKMSKAAVDWMQAHQLLE